VTGATFVPLPVTRRSGRIFRSDRPSSLQDSFRGMTWRQATWMLAAALTIAAAGLLSYWVASLILP